MPVTAKRSGTVGNLALWDSASAGFRGISHPFPRMGSHPSELRMGNVAESGAPPFEVVEKSTAIRVTSFWADDFGPREESSDLIGLGCYWNQHVEASLVRRPHRKTPTRTRRTQGGCGDGERVRQA